MTEAQEKALRDLSSLSVDAPAWKAICVEIEDELERITQDLVRLDQSSDQRMHFASQVAGGRRIRDHLLNRWKAAHRTES